MAEEQAPKKLTRKQQVFIDEYLKCFNGAEAARRAGYSEKNARDTAYDLLKNPDITRQIDERRYEIHIGEIEALKLQADIARGDAGIFFRPVDEWMFNPLPEYEILDQKEVLDEACTPPKVRISYRVYHVVLDMDKVRDPRYSHLIKKFTNSRKSGLSIELYNKQEAIRDALKIHGKFTERVDLTNSDGSLKPEEMKPSEIAKRVAALLKKNNVTNSD